MNSIQNTQSSEYPISKVIGLIALPYIIEAKPIIRKEGMHLDFGVDHQVIVEFRLLVLVG